MMRPRASMKASALALGAMIAAGCTGIPPVRGPMPGCYSVQPSAWSPDIAAVTGIRELPSDIGIDTDPERGLLVPKSWWAKVPSGTIAAWTDESVPWSGRGDLITRHRETQPRMAGDSMRVAFGLDAFAIAEVGPTTRGFGGSMTVMPRPPAPPTQQRLTLTRRDCAGLDLVKTRSSRQP
jgi:hypothetical protein